MKQGWLISMVLIAGLIFPAMAGADAIAIGANVDCWLEAPSFVAPGQNGNNLVLKFRNKGDADATALVMTLTPPAGVTMTAGSIPYNYGALANSTIVNSHDFTFDVKETVKPYSQLKWVVKCVYGEGEEKATAVTNVNPWENRTVIGEHYGPTDVSPDGMKVIFTDDDTDDLMVYDVRDGSLTRLTFDGLDNSHPVYSKDGSRIAFKKYLDDHATVWVMNADGTNPRPVIIDGTCWRPFAWAGDSHIVVRNCAHEIWLVNIKNGAMFEIGDGGTYNNWAQTKGDLLMIRYGSGKDEMEVWNWKTGVQVSDVSNFGETQMGVFKPGDNRVAFKDDYSGEGEIYASDYDAPNIPNIQCLTCKHRVKEYQLSTDADTIDLDYDEIVSIKGVWKVGDPKTNYWAGATATPVYGTNITLPTALSATGTDRVPVYVSYSYMDDYCDARPNYNNDGTAIVYKSWRDNAMGIWVMSANGARKVKVTNDPDEDDSYNQGLPRFVNNDTAIVFSGDSNLYLVKLDYRALSVAGVEIADGGEGDDMLDCGVVGANPSSLAFLLLGVPLLALLVIRRLAFSRV